MPVPDTFKEELVKRLEIKEYTSTSGYEILKQKMGNHLVIGNGLKPLIFILQMAFSHLYPDGYILHVLPAWVSYMEQTDIIKAKQISINCTKEDNWKLKPNKLEDTLKLTYKKPTLIIINNPTNPTG
jgi:aspartate/methionine/tyrosine aminotransferase